MNKQTKDLETKDLETKDLEENPGFIKLPQGGNWYTLNVLNSDQDYELGGYVITNKLTGVVEAETKLLPQACEYFRNLEKAYSAELAFREAESIEEALQKGMVGEYTKNKGKLN